MFGILTFPSRAGNRRALNDVRGRNYSNSRVEPLVFPLSYESVFTLVRMAGIAFCIVSNKNVLYLRSAIGKNLNLLFFLLIENKLIICALGNLHYKISGSEVRIPVLVQIFVLRSYNPIIIILLTKIMNKITVYYVIQNASVKKYYVFVAMNEKCPKPGDR